MEKNLDDDEKIINGAKIAESIKNNIKNNIEKLNAQPCLAVVLVGDDVASTIYIKHKKIACEYIGIKFILHKLDKNISTNTLLALINKLNLDKNINAILIQLPLPIHISEKDVLLSINPKKDVDGFHPYNIGLLSTNTANLTPCTPTACIEILKAKNIDLAGKHCVVIGRSNIVGKPLSMMLLNEDATVTTTHSKTKNLENITKTADIIIVATGIMNFLKPHMIKNGVVLIDVGMHRVDKKLFGDIDISCKENASLITPVPKGVGPMTVAMLMKNCLLAYLNQNNK